MSIVVVGDLMVDVVAALPGPLAHGSDTPARIAQHQGGSGANVAAWLAAAGAQVAFAGRCGADPLGDAALAALDGVALAVERDPERPTGTCIVLVHPGGERTMIPDAGANDALELAGLPDGGHVHLTGYGLLRAGSRPAMLRALELARERGAAVSVDPSSAAPLAAEPAFLDWVAGAGLLLPERRRGARADRRGGPGARRPRARPPSPQFLGLRPSSRTRRGGGDAGSGRRAVERRRGGAARARGRPPRSSTRPVPAMRSPQGCSPRAPAGPSRPSSSRRAARSPRAPSRSAAPVLSFENAMIGAWEVCHGPARALEEAWSFTLDSFAP